MHARPDASRAGLVPLLLVLVAAWVIAPALPAGAATITVNTTADGFDHSEIDGACDAEPAVAGEQCSLRAAVMHANLDAAHDTIVLPGGTYVLNAGGANTNELRVLSDMTIQGAGTGTTTIQQGLADNRVVLAPDQFGASTPSPDIDLTISGVTITGGNNDDAGAGITFTSTGGSLVLHEVAVTGNAATGGGGSGGGLMFSAAEGTLEVTSSAFTGNTAGSSGGGVRFGPGGQGTLRGTVVSGNTSETGGGGIAVLGGELSLVDTVVGSANIAPRGGGLFVDNFNPLPSVRLLRSEIAGNDATKGGGGAYVDPGGALTIEASRVSDNTLLGAVIGTAGGGIENNAGTVRILRSTIDGNTAFTNQSSGGRGGGIASESGGELVITNSTLSGNQASSSGGGISAPGSTSIVELSNVTITGNIADHDGGPLGGQGGGIAVGVSNATIRNSIIAANTNGGTGVPDCKGTIVSGGFNLIGDATGCDATGGGDLTGVSPVLGPLGPNGGPTLTHLPLAGSPAIDRGNPSGCADEGSVLAVDQRGGLRPADGDLDGVFRCDIGAVEVEGPLPTPEPPVSDGIEIGLRAKPKRVEPGERVLLIARIVPCPGTEGALVRFVRRAKQLGERAADDACRAQKRVKVGRTARFQARLSDGGVELVSNVVKVRVRAAR